MSVRDQMQQDQKVRESKGETKLQETATPPPEPTPEPKKENE